MRIAAIPRYLGIDYGTKRVGLAVGDSDGCIATPLRVLTRQGDRDRQAAEIVASGCEFGVDAYVLGIPYNMDGTEGTQAKLTRDFGRLLARRSGLPVFAWDERLSSHGADEYMAGSELTHKKKKARRDALAAQIILQTFLDADDRDAAPEC